MMIGYRGFLPAGSHPDHYCPHCDDVRWHGPGRCFVCNRTGIHGFVHPAADQPRPDRYQTDYETEARKQIEEIGR